MHNINSEQRNLSRFTDLVSELWVIFGSELWLYNEDLVSIRPSSPYWSSYKKRTVEKDGFKMKQTAAFTVIE